MHINTEFNQRNLSHVVFASDATEIPINKYTSLGGSPILLPQSSTNPLGALQLGKLDIFSPAEKPEKTCVSFPNERRYFSFTPDFIWGNSQDIEVVPKRPNPLHANTELNWEWDCGPPEVFTAGRELGHLHL